MNKPIPFGKYYLLERVNVGGMAEVFKAKAFGVEGFERLVAVKRILPNIAEDEEFITMFIDEAKIAVQLQHANVAQIFDLGKVDDSFFIALEFVHGKDMRAIFDDCRKTGDRMPTAQACFIIMQVCEGLDYAHNKRDPQGRELNLVHRDVSPQNILIGYEGEIKIVDFGIAKAAGKASKTQAGILKGKFGYMSPEQVRGLPVDRRSDIFALGILLYELLTGERLFVGESDFSTLEKVRNVEILPPSSFNRKIPTELERIVLKALAKDVEDRYQNAIDLHDDLQAFLYAVGEFYSRKDLSGWMKKTFASELAEQTAKLEEYEQLEEPTPAPVASMGAPAALAARGTPQGERGQGFEWDDEELETQIFDKPPDDAGENELTSSDIFLQEGDDKTVAGVPPDLLGLSDEEGVGVAAMGGAAQPYPLSRTIGAPPQGLSAFRQGGASQGPPSSVHLDAYNPGLRSSHDAMPAHDPLRSPYRQTIAGMPQAGGASYQPLSAVPARRPLEHLGRQSTKSRTPLYAAVAGVVLLVGLLAYRQHTRPGKIQISATPGDAEIYVDDVLVKGMPPVTIERPPGLYHLVLKRDGYVRKDQNLEVQPGEFGRIDMQLEASPDTGFELTSEPAGVLVWLDGQPFTGRDPQGSQARTNFKAYPVTPGRHVLEIRGDPKFLDWKLEFLQDPGKTHKLHADLVPRSAAPVPGARVAASPSAPKAPPAPRASAAPAPAVAAAPTPGPKAGVVQARHKVEPKPAPPVAAAVPQGPADEPPVTRPRPASVHRTVAVAPRAEPESSGDDKSGSGACVMSIGAKPWAKVAIDGKDTGRITPLIDYKIPCGKHKLTLKNADLPIELTKGINVRAGEKFKQVFSLIDTEE